MTNTITIPPEAVEAAASSIATHDGWGFNWTAYEETATAAIRAALAAWPGMVKNYSWDASHGRIILPLNTEPSDE